MSRLTRVPSNFSEYALIDANEVRAIEPMHDMPGRCYVHMSGGVVKCTVSVQEAAELLGLPTAAPISGDTDKSLAALLKAAEAVLDAWKIGGEKLAGAVVDLDCEVAQVKAMGYE